MYWLYNLLGLGYLLISCPYYLGRVLSRKDYREGFASRFGILSSELRASLASGKWIWVHAVSVGEFLAAEPLVKELRTRCPDHSFLVSTVTPTGQQLARKSKHVDHSLYLPLDILGFAIDGLFEMVRPELLVLMETEIWPNLIRIAHRKDVPIALVNGRISDRSYPRYRKVRCFLRKLLPQVSFFGVQTAEDAKRMRSLGAREESIQVTGNCKFDTVSTPSQEALDEFRALLNPNGDRKLIVGGSTHPGEEEMLGSVFKRLRADCPDLLLLLAPRHIERRDSIVRTLSRMDVKVICRTDLSGERSAHDADVVVLDTIGELSRIYSLAEIVVIGKSFLAEGGQNPLEPAAVGKPVFMGPHTENFREVARLLVEGGGALQVKNEQELYDQIKRFLENPELGAETGRKAKEIVDSQRGACARNAEILCRFLN